MTLCSGVKDYFIDPSTHLRHSCTYVCYTENPLSSPIDCKELCPEYFDCLVRHANGEKSPSPPTSAISTPKDDPEDPQSFSMTLVVMVAVAAVAVIIITAAVIIVYCKKLSRLNSLKNRQSQMTASHSMHNELLSNTPPEQDTLMSSMEPSSQLSVHSNQVHYIPRQHHRDPAAMSMPGNERLSEEESLGSGRSVLAPSGSRVASEIPLSLHSDSARVSGGRMPSLTHHVSIATQTFPETDDDNAVVMSPSVINPHVSKEMTPPLSYPVQETDNMIPNNTRRNCNDIHETIPKNL